MECFITFKFIFIFHLLLVAPECLYFTDRRTNDYDTNVCISSDEI